VGSVGAALALPPLVALLPHQGGRALVVFTVALAAFVIWAHRTNVRRILKGEEHRFGRPRPERADA
jgi:glycerol-3-phosphate acyltransferase PlsY